MIAPSYVILHLDHHYTECEWTQSLNCALRHTVVPACSLGLKDVVEEVLPALLEQGIAVLILTKGCDTTGMMSLLDKFEEASDEPVSAALRSAVSRKSPALYVYTSGTTGRGRYNPMAAFGKQIGERFCPCLHAHSWIWKI